jgi:hypothetical protein
MGLESMAKKLMAVAGCSRVKSALLKSYLFCYGYGKTSSELREELLDWTIWLTNKFAALGGLLSHKAK